MEAQTLSETGPAVDNDADRPAALREVMSARNLSRPQKAAAVMLSLPKNKAARIMAYLSELEVEQLTLEIATLRRIPRPSSRR